MLPASILRRDFPLLLILIAILFSSCFKLNEVKNKASFDQVTGINFIEVRRSFENGLSFDKNGYQLSPEWKLSFLPQNKASIYNPLEKRFLTFAVTIDHDSLFNMANTWFKAIKITKDSLKFQVLKLDGRTVYFNKSKNYMTFYSDKYIKNVLHTNAEELKKPLRRDSLFVHKRVADANAHIDTFFAARQPAVFTSKSPLVTVVKEKIEANEGNRYDNSEEYISPVYDITINNAYEDFSYSFLVSVDTQAKLHFMWSLIYTFPEFKASNERVIKGIINGYLKAYVNVIPGSTLGIPHSSSVTLNVIGKKRGHNRKS